MRIIHDLMLGRTLLALALAAGGAWAQRPEVQPADAAPSTYVLGPEDLVTIRVPDAEEIPDKPLRIGANGELNLPLAGRVRAAGLTAEQLEAELTARLKTYLQDPQVSVSVSEFRSQPVSIIGSVGAAGVHQLQGAKTLVEMLSLAGGVRQDAGNTIKITRKLEWGRLPLRTAKDDETGQFSVGEVSLKTVLEASSPAENIAIRPNDIISVPRADMVYVVGDVPRSGAFVLNERERLSLLQALTLAGGLTRTSFGEKAKILRARKGASRTELPVNLKKVLAGKGEDLALQPDDILFIPNSTRRTITTRGLDSAIGGSVGILSALAVYRP
jgi:polysaccharide export outer membrane protein